MEGHLDWVWRKLWFTGMVCVFSLALNFPTSSRALWSSLVYLYTTEFATGVSKRKDYVKSQFMLIRYVCVCVSCTMNLRLLCTYWLVTMTELYSWSLVLFCFVFIYVYEVLFYLWVPCLYWCMCAMCVPGVLRAQKRPLDPWDCLISPSAEMTDVCYNAWLWFFAFWSALFPWIWIQRLFSLT